MKLRDWWSLAVMLFLAALLGWFVWPGRFVYRSWHGEVVRIDRLTGAPWVLADDGWHALRPSRAGRGREVITLPVLR
jgi:hypothetical protein